MHPAATTSWRHRTSRPSSVIIDGTRPDRPGGPAPPRRPGRLDAHPPVPEDLRYGDLQLKPGTSWAETYARCVPSRARGVRARPHPEPHRRRAGGASAGPATTSPRSTARRSRARRGWTGRPPQRPVERARREHEAWEQGRPGRAPGAGDAPPSTMMAAHARPARAAAGLGDRQAVAAGLRRRRPRPRRGALVRRGDRAPADVDGRARARCRGRCRNIASWNYPMSVQVHAELVQALAGNGVVAKTPSQGGFHCLTLAHAFMARAGLPVTLLSGVGSKLGEALISSEGIGALAFVGWPVERRPAATTLADTGNAALPRAGGPQRLGHLGVHPVGPAGPAPAQGLRVRQAALHRLPALRRAAPAAPGLPRALPAGDRGHAVRPPAGGRDRRRPVAGAGLRAGDPCPQGERADRAVRRGAAPAGLPLYRGSVGDGRFLDGQDTAAYVAPACVLEPPAQLVAAPRRAVRPAGLGGHASTPRRSCSPR